jgi:hypothetical protein
MPTSQEKTNTRQDKILKYNTREDRRQRQDKTRQVKTTTFNSNLKKINRASHLFWYAMRLVRGVGGEGGSVCQGDKTRQGSTKTKETDKDKEIRDGQGRTKDKTTTINNTLAKKYPGLRTFLVRQCLATKQRKT